MLSTCTIYKVVNHCVNVFESINDSLYAYAITYKVCTIKNLLCAYHSIEYACVHSMHRQSLDIPDNVTVI